MLMLPMFFRRTPKPVSTKSRDSLDELVHAHMHELDQETQRLIVAIAGLLACVAHVDHQYTPEEQSYLREALGRVNGLTAAGVDAICGLVAEHGAKIAAVNPQAYTRELRERLDIELRREMLDVLVDLGAADGELSLAETDLLRRTTSALGLTPEDYLASQTRHRDKLKLLRR
jgi:uncharacterized tellurite resistance protein B-like protein